MDGEDLSLVREDLIIGQIVWCICKKTMLEADEKVPAPTVCKLSGKMTVPRKYN
jgi:hypothetical protein